MYKTLVVIIFSLVFLSCQNSIQKSSKKPNIILILADDAGYADFGFMGSKEIKTPNIDKLAHDGIIFNDAHVSSSVCSPSRAGILTGRYQQRFGHECNLDDNWATAFDSSELTIAEALKSAQYTTGIIGKWHLGDKDHHHPLNNGFDYFWGFIAGGRSYFPLKDELENPNLRTTMENWEYTGFNGYLTDVLGEKAIEYVDSHKNDENPFFLYLSFNAPHTPMHAKKEVLEMFEENPRKVYASMMWSMDEAVGNLIDKLKSDNIYEDTLIFFLSDNGGAHNNNSSVYPLKGWKGNQFEGGIRVPMIMTWKNQIKEKTKFDGLVSSLDIFKTSISVAGVTKKNDKPLDGKNLLATIDSSQTENLHEKLFWRKGQMATVRKGDYKLIRLNSNATVLYNLKENLQENLDLKELEPETHKDLLLELSTWEQDLISPLWKENRDWNIVTEKIYEDLMQNKKARVKSPSDLKNLNQ